jgi:hypothetical protein
MPVASLLDIAAMKIEAIASRGAKKDFFDLYFICRSAPGLQGALEAFEKRFASAHPDRMHRLKALVYFEDAEHEPDPELVHPARWSDVRAYFEDALRSLWSKE